MRWAISAAWACGKSWHVKPQARIVGNKRRLVAVRGVLMDEVVAVVADAGSPATRDL